MKIEFIKPPSWQDINFLGQEIDEDVAKLGRREKIEYLGFFIKNDEGRILGGTNGFTICGCIHIDQLWVHESLRGQGFGRQLMEKMHDYGRGLSFKIATVQTLDLQGKRGFYERLGYQCDLERPGYSDGALLLCLRKEL